MSKRSGPDDPTEEQPVTFTMEIQNGRTEIRVAGDRDTSVIVESASGETVYLPPEDFDRAAESDSPRSTYDSPYEAGSGSQNSPYTTGHTADTVTGLEPTADGYVIVHPEPITDVRFLR